MSDVLGDEPPFRTRTRVHLLAFYNFMTTEHNDNFYRRSRFNYEVSLYRLAVFYWGSCRLACSISELTPETVNPFRHLLGLPGRGIGPSRGLSLHWAAQHIITPGQCAP
jgi:hypothetical protein